MKFETLMPNLLNLTLTITTTIWVVIVGIFLYDKLSVFTLHLAVHVFLGGWEAEAVFLKKTFWQASEILCLCL